MLNKFISNKKIALFTLLSVLIVACNSNKTEDTVADSTAITAIDTTLTPTVPIKEKITECFIYTKNRDTATLKLNIENEELTGELNYRLFEKDSNTGTIAGEIKGDTIIAEYIFDSEGMRSVREVVFLKRDGKFYEGFGEAEETNGKMMFKNRGQLKFGDAIVFSPTNCK